MWREWDLRLGPEIGKRGDKTRVTVRPVVNNYVAYWLSGANAKPDPGSGWCLDPLVKVVKVAVDGVDQPIDRPIAELRGDAALDLRAAPVLNEISIDVEFLQDAVFEAKVLGRYWEHECRCGGGLQRKDCAKKGAEDEPR